MQGKYKENTKKNIQKLTESVNTNPKPAPI